MTTQGVQIWTVPETATYTITAAGAVGVCHTYGQEIVAFEDGIPGLLERDAMFSIVRGRFLGIP
jgi:hypothetical protein